MIGRGQSAVGSPDFAPCILEALKGLLCVQRLRSAAMRQRTGVGACLVPER